MPITVEEKIDIVSSFIFKRPIPYELRILIAIYKNPNLTRKGIMGIMNSNSFNVKKGINQLIANGMVKTTNEPYWVNAINAWRVNQGLVASEAGKRHLYAVFNEIDNVLCK